MDESNFILEQSNNWSNNIWKATDLVVNFLVKIFTSPNGSFNILEYLDNSSYISQTQYIW